MIRYDMMWYEPSYIFLHIRMHIWQNEISDRLYGYMANKIAD